MNLLAVLVLVAGGNPVSVTTRIGRAPDASEHVTRCHYERRENAASSPGPAVVQDRRNVTKGDCEAQEPNGDGDPAGPVYGISVRDGDGGVA